MFFELTMKSCDKKHLSGSGSFADHKYKIFNDSTNLFYNKNDDSAAPDICNEEVQSTTDNIKKGGFRPFEMLSPRKFNFKEKIKIIYI